MVYLHYVIHTSLRFNSGNSKLPRSRLLYLNLDSQLSFTLSAGQASWLAMPGARYGVGHVTPWNILL